MEKNFLEIWHDQKCVFITDDFAGQSVVQISVVMLMEQVIYLRLAAIGFNNFDCMWGYSCRLD